MPAPSHSPTPASTSAVRVVVVTYDSADTIGAFLDSLAEATRRPVDVVVADNSPGPETVQALGSRAVTTVRTGGNIGYGRAANLGAAHPTGDGSPSEWIVIANPDIVWTKGSLDRLLDAAEQLPGAGAFGPVLRQPDGERYPSARAFPSLGTGVGHALLSRAWPTNPWTAKYHEGQGESDLPGTCRTDWLSGACLLVRREAFDAVRGFDPAYFMFFEDVDLCDRLRRAGWDRVFVLDAEVLHTGGASWRERQSTAMSIAHHRSAARYLASRYDRWYQLPLRLALRAGLTVRGRLTHT